ncbi:transducin/WD40 repeat-like superfamily protein [Striga asiatica]|uniref:Transducin/WD40 repeat-like superfamily protein n=1 Tax=Striga asiatica TaxID=4170 RepID=A0A5A7RCQ9_STRAF|nr:transducin/WD40 repeat-like superfamily protein [Striga asiatica]
MISSISWVPKGVSKTVPTAAEPPSNEKIEELLKSGVLETRGESENEENDEDMNVDAVSQGDELSRALSAASALGKASKSSKMESDSLADALKELDMDNYDEDDDGVELFGSGLGNLYYPSNDMDPYLKGQDEEDSEEEEDITIKPEDAVIVCARNEDDVSHLEACNFLSGYWKTLQMAIPTCMCTMILSSQHFHSALHGSVVLLKVERKGTSLLLAPWNQPLRYGTLILWMKYRHLRHSVALSKRRERERRQDLTLANIYTTVIKFEKSIKYKDGSHTDAVLGLAWNKAFSNGLASASADKLVKIWDVATEACTRTFATHTDKARMNLIFSDIISVLLSIKLVQAVAWNDFAPSVLLSGSFDHTVNMVSLENGTVTGFDIRKASSNSSSQPEPSFTIHAHDKAVCTIAYNSSVPNLLATGSEDKMVKLWDLSNQPTCIASKNPKAGAVFSVSFSEDCPFTLAIGGSKGKLQVWDLLTDAEIARRYGKYANKAKSSTS